MQVISDYFPNLSDLQIKQFAQLEGLYKDLNEKVNVISRKDIENLYVRHVLHSLSIAKFISFKPGTKIIDVGTGGGFPGVPLAIFFPEVSFHLVDSIAKKLKVIDAVCEAIQIKNVRTEHTRVEKVKDRYDFIISRALTAFPKFVNLTKSKISLKQNNSMPNGIIYLKGGDFDEEVKQYKKAIEIVAISDYFKEEFFETKKIIYYPL